jgi:hypothetical protein
MLGVGVALLLAPTALQDGWPWPLTPLTGRAVGAWAVGIGTIAAHAAWENDWWRRPMMLSYTALGLLQLTAVLRFPTDLDWATRRPWSMWASWPLSCCWADTAGGRPSAGIR